MVQFTRRNLMLFTGMTCFGWLVPSQASAQQRKPLPGRTSGKPVAPSGKKLNTTISIEVLSPQGPGFNSREWAELFQELDVQFSIRKALEREEPATTEKSLGLSIREIQIIGVLARDGSIAFEDRVYSPADAVKVREWIADMKAYGAQGSPKGQPMWGLSKAQFEEFFQALANPVKAELEGKPLELALQAFQVRNQLPIRFSASANELSRKLASSSKVRNHYTGLTEGTVLSAMLNEFGLGFYPRRTPDGKLELQIVKLGEQKEVWPAGWPPSEDLVKLRPDFFQFREVELTDEPLLDVVQAIADIIEVPVLINESALRSRNIDVRTKTVSHKKKKVILSAALKHLCYQGKCKYEYRMDEAGKPLLWLTPERNDTPE